MKILMVATVYRLVTLEKRAPCIEWGGNENKMKFLLVKYDNVPVVRVLLGVWGRLGALDLARCVGA